MNGILLVSRRLCGLALTLCVGCGPAMPSKELIAARRVYDDTRRSHAVRIVPFEVLAARIALDRAERLSKVDPGSPAEASLAYIARRRAELARVKADQVVAHDQHRAATHEYIELQSQLHRSGGK
jgi:hypothetical protein